MDATVTIWASDRDDTIDLEFRNAGGEPTIVTLSVEAATEVMVDLGAAIQFVKASKQEVQDAGTRQES